jgi:hypothetical protein
MPSKLTQSPQGSAGIGKKKVEDEWGMGFIYFINLKN